MALAKVRCVLPIEMDRVDHIAIYDIVGVWDQNTKKEWKENDHNDYDRT